MLQNTGTKNSGRAWHVIPAQEIDTKLLVEAILSIGYIFRSVGRRRTANPTLGTRCQRASTYTCSSANPEARPRAVVASVS